MKLDLSFLQVRVIGALLEKQYTTPDQYPLSINALVNACNQKSNRHPVLQLAEQEVQETVDGLVRKHLVLERSGFGSRVAKYQQRFSSGDTGMFRLNRSQQAILCELMLRGPQTAGELRVRAARMAAIKDVAEVELELEDLLTRPDGPFVIKLPRESGKRESRFALSFCDGAAFCAEQAVQKTDGPANVDTERLERLEAEVGELRAELAALRNRVGGESVALVANGVARELSF